MESSSVYLKQKTETVNNTAVKTWTLYVSCEVMMRIRWNLKLIVTQWYALLLLILDFIEEQS